MRDTQMRDTEIPQIIIFCNGAAVVVARSEQAAAEVYHFPGQEVPPPQVGQKYFFRNRICSQIDGVAGPSQNGKIGGRGGPGGGRATSCRHSQNRLPGSTPPHKLEKIAFS